MTDLLIHMTKQLVPSIEHLEIYEAYVDVRTDDDTYLLAYTIEGQAFEATLIVHEDGYAYEFRTCRVAHTYRGKVDRWEFATTSRLTNE